MAPKFQGFLGCVQMKVFSSVMIECASNLEGIPCFVPLHCLKSKTKSNVNWNITEGLSTIMKRAETKKWNGKKTITLKTQNIIDPFLAALYNTYSLSADLTNPYKDSSSPVPDTVMFTIDITYVSEGEEDSCKLEVLLHDHLEIVMYVWKEFKRYEQYVFIRYMKTTWNMRIQNGTKLDMQYNILYNKMSTDEGEMDKIVGWPHQRLSITNMIEEVILKKNLQIKKLSRSTYKWIKKVSGQYLDSMGVDLDAVNSDGLTLLHVLADLKKSTYVKFVIGKIKNVDPYDSSGKTPLHIACANSNLKTAQILIQHGANVNALTKNGDSPIMLLAAQENTQLKLIKLLLDFNAKRDVENKDKMRAVDLARVANSKADIIHLLQPT